MFYGFDESKRDEVQNERKHFTPWSGGAYGGSIVFEVNGKEYKLTRTFGTRTKVQPFPICSQDKENCHLEKNFKTTHLITE